MKKSNHNEFRNNNSIILNQKKDTINSSNYVYTRRIVIISLILLCIFFTYFLLVYYPVPSDRYDFWHMAFAINTEKSAHIDFTYSNIGYYILTIFISKITNISYDVIPTLPLLAISLILLIIIIFRRIINNQQISLLIIFLLIIVYTIRYGNQASVQWWTHGIGFILSLLIIYLIILKMNLNKYSIPIDILLIIALISLNEISYKLTFFILTFLIILQIIEWVFFKRSKLENRRMPTFVPLIMIGVIFALTFNKIFYDTFIPRLIDSPDFFTLSLNKIFLPFFPISSDSLNQFYFKNLVDIQYANFIWLSIIITGIVILFFNILLKSIKRKNILFGEKIISALLVSSIIILIVYLSFGVFEVSLLIFSGLLGFSVLSSVNSNKIRKSVIIIIIILILLNFYVTIRNIENEYDSGTRDNNNIQYITYSSKWYIKNVITNIPSLTIKTRSDVFTSGYFVKEIAKSNVISTYQEDVFSKEDMKLLLTFNTISQDSYEKIYIINYRLRQFSAKDWEIFDSWARWKNIIDKNQYLNSIYTSGDISLYKMYI